MNEYLLLDLAADLGYHMAVSIILVSSITRIVMSRRKE